MLFRLGQLVNIFYIMLKWVNQIFMPHLHSQDPWFSSIFSDFISLVIFKVSEKFLKVTPLTQHPCSFAHLAPAGTILLFCWISLWSSLLFSYSGWQNFPKSGGTPATCCCYILNFLLFLSFIGYSSNLLVPILSHEGIAKCTDSLIYWIQLVLAHHADY